MKTKCPLPKGFSGTKRVFGILVALLGLALLAAPGAGAAPVAYVSSFSENMLYVVDGTSVIRKVPVGVHPLGVAVNPAGTRAYVVNSSLFKPNDVPTVSVIDTALVGVAGANPVIATVTGFSGNPNAVAVSPDGTRVYVASNDGSVAVIDAGSNTVIDTRNTGGMIEGIVVAGSSVYVTDPLTGSVIDVMNNRRLCLNDVPVGDPCPGIPVVGIATNPADPSGSRIYVTNSDSSMPDNEQDLVVTVIDTATLSKVAVVHIGLPTNLSGRSPAGVALSPSGGFIYAPILVENVVAAINVATNEVVKVAVGQEPFGVAVDPTGTRVYVVNSATASSSVTVLDATTDPPSIIATVPVGLDPMGFGSFVAVPPPPQFTLSRYTVGSGTIVADPPSATGKYPAGKDVKLEARPDATFAFTGWSDACSSSGTNPICNVKMNEDKSVTATFTAQYTLYITVLGNGTVEQVPMPTAGKYLAGTPVTLTAKPAADSLFTGWTSCPGASGVTCNLTMDGTKSVTATFARKQFVLTVTKNGTGSGTVAAQPSSTTWTYDIGTTVTLSATPTQFAGWSGDACSGSTSPSCDVRMDGARNVTATFTLPPPPPAPAPTTCDDKIKDLEQKVAADKHPWRHDHQLKAALRLHAAAKVELGKAKAKVGENDKRYVRALKEFNNGKAALCNGRYWHAHHELWESYYIAHEILKQHRR